MSFLLICQEGFIKGQEFAVPETLHATLQIGRSRGDIQLRDPKCSKVHAKIFRDSKGLFQIQDLDSSHGTLLNGVKITKVTPLKSGDFIGIGKTVLAFQEMALPKIDPIAPAKPAAPPQLAPQVEVAVAPIEAPKAVVPEKKTWKDHVTGALEAFERESSLPVAPVVPLVPFLDPVVLDFAQGLQSGQTLVFGFGPRSVGLHCNEGLLIDGSADQTPPVAFELHPSPNALCELRAVADNIQVNGRVVKVQTLKGGDQISFGKTTLVVRATASEI